MTLAVFPGISPCNSHTWLDMGLKLLARACPQHIIEVVKYFSYWVNGSYVARSQSSAMGQNDPYRTSSVKALLIILPTSIYNASQIRRKRNSLCTEPCSHTLFVKTHVVSCLANDATLRSLVRSCVCKLFELAALFATTSSSSCLFRFVVLVINYGLHIVQRLFMCFRYVVNLLTEKLCM